MPALEAIPEPELPVASSNDVHHFDSTVDRLDTIRNKRKRTPKKPEKSSTNDTVVRVVPKLTWSSLDSTDDDDDGASVSGIPRANKSVNLFPRGVTSTSDSSETSDFDDDVPTISLLKNVLSSTGRPSKDPEIITDSTKNKPEMITTKSPVVRVELPEEYRPSSSVESKGTKTSPTVTAVVDENLPVENASPSGPEEPTVPDDETITSETPSVPDFDDVPMIRLNESMQQERKSTPKKTKINKTKTIADIFNETFERLERFRPSSPDESIASSRGRRSLPKTNLKVDTQTGDETNTDDFFDSPSDYQPTSDSEKDDKRKNSTDSSASEEEHQSIIEKPKKKSPELVPAIGQEIQSPRKPTTARSVENRRPVISRPKKNSPKTNDRSKSTRTPKRPKTITKKQIKKNSLLDTSTQSTKWKSKEYISSSSSDSDGDQLPVIPRLKKKSPNHKAIDQTKLARTPKKTVQRKAKKNTSLDTSTQSTIPKSKEYISTSSESEEDQQSFAEKLKKKSSKLVHPPKSTTTPTKESSKSPQKAISDEDSTTEVPDENSETRSMPDLENVSNSVVPDPVFSSALVPVRKKSIPELDELSETISTDDETVLPPAKKLKRSIKTREKNKSHEYESDDTGEELFIETESLAPDDDLFEIGKEKSVFDEISSSETDSDVEEVYEPEGRKKAGERRKFSSLQKMKEKYLEEIVGWLPWKRNTVSILIETIRDKLLKREFDGIDEILKALVIRIGSPSRVAIGNRVHVSSLAVLTPIIFSQLPEQLPESVIRQFEPEDQKAFLSYLNKSVVKRTECEMEPIIQNLIKLTLENEEHIENQIKILSDTIHDINKVFSSQTKSRRSVGNNKENHQPKVDHLLLCLLFQFEYMQVKGSREAQVLAEKIVSKIERSASHQRVGIQALGSIMKGLKEIGIENQTIDKWNAIVVETSYSGAGEDELQRMQMEELKKEFANNKISEAGFQLAKMLKRGGQPIEATKTLIEYVSYNRVKCDLSVQIWEFLRSLLEEKEALEWFKEVRGLGSPQSFRKMFLKLSIDNPVEVAEVKRNIREMCI
ncbi:Oidioi.mRNA.OKI2018_I69.chr2.g5789.t1.cds [Oikopleura dioica]|uniref:Oidioi.mRNA.OKI2018_I69.chr2.g5789.t1.cds n=1 Tax=Oikopleura dioica TaxID=34765 RepID=A0ABN7T0W4_OIKDI|nr:Oidioi.mRNA.OKI2018_I69.chr2.g5789.t1.cds [Oikopleura dioica]